MSVFELHGRKALVTGGARGLGAGMAEALARAGAAVAVGDIREDIGKATVDALAQSGGIARAVPLNVTDEASWEAAIALTIYELDSLDIVVNNAGIEISELVIDLNPQNLLRMLEVNTLGVALGIKHAFRAMRPGGAAAKGGAVIHAVARPAATACAGDPGGTETKS